LFGRRRAEADGGENPRLALQRFIYDDDGFIACRADDNLVLGVHEQDAVNVSLMRRKVEDIYQRWIINDNGYQLPRFSPVIHSLKISSVLIILQSVPKKWNPSFNFAITSVYTNVSNFFYCYNKKCMTHKSKIIRPPPHLYSVTPLPSKTHTTDASFSNV